MGDDCSKNLLPPVWTTLFLKMVILYNIRFWKSRLKLLNSKENLLKSLRNISNPCRQCPINVCCKLFASFALSPSFIPFFKTTYKKQTKYITKN